MNHSESESLDGAAAFFADVAFLPAGDLAGVAAALAGVFFCKTSGHFMGCANLHRGGALIVIRVARVGIIGRRRRWLLRRRHRLGRRL